MIVREFGEQLLQNLLNHVTSSVPDALGAGLGLSGPTPHGVSGIGVAAELDAAQWEVGEGPLWEALRSGEVVALPARPTLPGGDADTRFSFDSWPRLAERLSGTSMADVQGMVVIPGEWGGDTPVIFSVYLSSPPQRDTLEQVDRLESLLANALAVVEYCAGEEMRAQQLLQMTQYRRVIEQAKGLLMGVLEDDASAAFETLSRASQHFNVRLRNLAVALVEHVGSAPAEGPEDPTAVIVPSAEDRKVAAQVWAALSAGRAGPERPSV